MRRINDWWACGVLATSLLVGAVFAGSAAGADWDPNDETFDPNVKSVVIGDRSWLGDPSQFTHVGLGRLGYTHVNATNYPNFDPSVNVSLMVPLEVGETKPPAGGMLMLNEDQAVELVKNLRESLKSESNKEKPATIKTMLEGAVWTVSAVDKDDRGRHVLLDNKIKDKVDSYRFSSAAAKKLVGAIEHSLKTLKELADN